MQKLKNPGKEGKQRWLEVAYNAGVLMRVPFVHLDVLASDEQEPEVTILMPDGVHPVVINPPEEFKNLPVPTTNSLPLAAAEAASLLRTFPFHQLILLVEQTLHHILSSTTTQEKKNTQPTPNLAALVSIFDDGIANEAGKDLWVRRERWEKIRLGKGSERRKEEEEAF